MDGIDLNQQSGFKQSANSGIAIAASKSPHKPRKHPPDYDNSKHGKRLPFATKVAVMAMKESGMTATQVAKASGVHVSTITRAWENPELEELVPSVVQKTKTGMSGLFYKRGLQGLLSMTPEKFEQSSLLQIATTVGIMTEKGRLMEGLSTENLSFRGISQSIEADRAKIMERIQELEGK